MTMLNERTGIQDADVYLNWLTEPNRVNQSQRRYWSSIVAQCRNDEAFREEMANSKRSLHRKAARLAERQWERYEERRKRW